MAFIRVAPTTGYATPRRRPCPARNRIARPANAELLTPPKYPANNMENGTDIRTVQDLLGHQDVTTTQIYTQVMKKPGLGVRSPLDLP